MSQHLYGIHDPGGEHLFGDKSGWIVHTVDVRSDERIYYTDQQARVATPIVRLNWSHHGDGTIPPNPNDWDRFAWLCANYAKGCLNVTWLTIGNEPNLRVEWGRDEPITPEQYAACYRLVYDAIKAAVPGVLIAPAAIGPWNIDSGIDWIEYFKRMLDAIGPERIDWFNLHTYSRGYEPRAVTDNSRMDAPYSAYFNGFRSYLDFLAAVPAELRHLPVHITEANGNGPWPDSNTGWVQAACAEIDRNNRLASTQKIYSLCLFRWPKFDAVWQFETKSGVHEDFRAAVEKGYRVPEFVFVNEKSPKPIHNPDSVSQDIHKTYLPHVAGGAPQPVQPREWDERLTKRKVELIEHQPQPGETYWRLVKAEYLEEKEHIFVNTLDEQGRPLPGVVVACSNGGEVGRATEDKFNDPYALGMVNFPMFAAGWAYSVRVAGWPSDTVIGMGLGTYDEPTVGHHISYRLTFQRVQSKTQSSSNSSSNPQPVPEGEPPKENAMISNSGAIDPLVLEAIIKVESGGQAYGPDGRLLIRFEAHIFDSRYPSGRFRYNADKPWTGQQVYVNGQWQNIHTGRQGDEYLALEKAKVADFDAAYESISMGLGQIMGFNAKRIGYASAYDMFCAFRRSEAAQVIGLINFFLSDPQLTQAARSKDWRTIARLYNGPGDVDRVAPLLQRTYEGLRNA